MVIITQMGDWLILTPRLQNSPTFFDNFVVFKKNIRSSLLLMQNMELKPRKQTDRMELLKPTKASGRTRLLSKPLHPWLPHDTRLPLRTNPPTEHLLSGTHRICIPS